MSQQVINPYAVSEDHRIEPIRFCGEVPPDLHWKSAREIVPMERGARIVGWIWVAAVVPWSLWVIYVGVTESTRIFPLVWLLLGGTLSIAFWLPMMMFAINHLGAAGRRLRRLTEAPSLQRGWIDGEGITSWKDGVAIRCSWRFFDPPTLFPDYICLPDRFDSRIHLFLPWHNFGSAEEYQAAREFLHDRVSGPDETRPKPSTAHELFGERRQDFEFETSVADSWSMDHWPPVGEPAAVKEFRVDVNGGNSLARRIIESIFGSMIAILMLGLPAVVSVIAWLLYDYAFFGGWGFLLQNHMANSTVLVPCAILALLAVFFFVHQWQAQTDRFRDLSRIAIGNRGIYVGCNYGEIWWDWSDIIKVKTSDTKASFLSKGSIEPFELRAVSFERDSEFRRYQRLLEEHSPVTE